MVSRRHGRPASTRSIVSVDRPALRASSAWAVASVDPFVLVPEATYARLKALVTEDDPDAFYAGIADIAPEDWEDPAAYGLTPTP